MTRSRQLEKSSQVIALPALIHVDAKSNLRFIEFGGIDHLVIVKGWVGCDSLSVGEQGERWRPLKILIQNCRTICDDLVRSSKNQDYLSKYHHSIDSQNFSWRYSMNLSAVYSLSRVYCGSGQCGDIRLAHDISPG
jgi:hypothetical protein